ncbi:putative 26S proteasome non-ATPase regulatory subunit 3 [Hibiscus syriacus]|uniref:26S proteasome non-ATPase regulatory subunit 3 n=1 Tax=Hibiscus syriacus TaxID=106335 RepID=A0A6A2YZZ5_HIBSY|nr:putative 26S proteasome non-ATPase regulatory subunit 3 [Hibiscus syriacus]
MSYFYASGGDNNALLVAVAGGSNREVIDVFRIVCGVRLTFGLRRKLTAPLLSAFLDFVLQPGSEAHSTFSSFLPKLLQTVLLDLMEDEHCMEEVDTVTYAVQTPTKHLLPELEIYCYLLVLLFLIDQKKYNEAKACSSASINRLKSPNRRTHDTLASRLYFYYSYSRKAMSSLVILPKFVEISLPCIVLLHGTTMSSAWFVIINIEVDLDQAEKLRSKAPRFEAQSNQQFSRYLFYQGKIRTIQLEYTGAKESLAQATRKAPVAALDFRIQCNKWAILDVRIADLELFQSVAVKFTSTLSTDKTQNLIARLRHNVIFIGLRNISISYSFISLADVAEKLRLNSETPVADAESIVAKVTRDGAIDATLDHANGWMVSREIDDIYSTNEPQTAFHSRIAFCLNMHNEAVQAMYFPQKTLKEKGSA